MNIVWALIAIIPSVAAAQVVPAETLFVSVNATKTARVPADRVIAYVVVEGTAETGADAEARLNQKLTAVTAALGRMSASVRIDKPVS